MLASGPLDRPGEPIGSRGRRSAVTSPRTVIRPVLEAPLREYSSPLTVDIPATGNLTDDVVRNAADAPDAVAFSRRRGDDWEDVTAGAFLDEVRAVAKGLVAAGIQTGDRVGLISKTRYEWTLVDYAIWFAGAVTVPVYETSSAEQIEWILGNSGATAVVAEGPAHTARIAERRSALESLNHVWSLEADDASTLLFLPLAHVFARIIQVGAVKARVRLGHSADIKHLLTDLDRFKPTFVLAVPRVFEKIFNTASQKATAEGRGGIFERAADTSIAYSRALDRGKVPLALRGRHAVFSRLVYGRLRAALGGRCRYAVSGGAPLGDRLGHFYRGIGLVVLEGYGLTETTAALTANRPDALKIGTVGQPLPGTEVRVAEDGELLFRGGQVFAGYWENEPATAEVLGRDGWFHTGDVGEIDEEGFVRITGRKKEILVTAGGKNVAPAVLEDRVRAHALVSQCLV